MRLKEFKGKDFYGYSCLFTNTKKDPKDTAPYQCLRNLGLTDNSIKMDVSNTGIKKRPVLEELIKTLNAGDWLYVSDINDFLGSNNKGSYYYRQILEKGIVLIIADLNHTFFHINPLSTVFEDSSPLKMSLDIDKQVEFFINETKNLTNRTAGRNKQYDLGFSDEWKNLYFNYEAYRITLEELLKGTEKFGITSPKSIKIKFADYERTPFYRDDVFFYTSIDREFINLPKRMIERSKETKYVIPEEIVFLEKELQEKGIRPETDIDKIEYQTFISQKSFDNYFFMNDIIYTRYEKLRTMVVPRKCRPDGFLKVW